MKRFLVFLCLFILNISLSHAAVTINVVESGGDVVATATGSLDLTGLPNLGSISAGLNRGVIQGSNANPGNTDSLLYVGGGVGVTLYQISTDFIYSDNAAAVISNSDSGDVIGIVNNDPSSYFDHLRISSSYTSGDPVNSTSTWLGHTITSLGLLTGTYNITWAADSISINVVATPPTAYSIEGTVTGLTALGLVLQNNTGDDLDVFTNGNFLFDTRLDDGSAYAVTVLTHPTGQTCSVTNGSGTISGAGVTDVTVTCEDDPVATYSVGGTVSGSGNDFTLLNNGGDALTITSDGSFTFDTAVPEGDLYAVSVDASSLDPSDSCSVTNGNGTMGTSDVTNVAVTCEHLFQLGGIISGVSSGGSITLQNNGGDDLTWNDDPITSYRFPTRLAQGATYNVNVLTPPTGQTCTVANATGTMSNSNFVDVNVTCVDDVVPPAPVVPIPTMSQWALILLSTLLGLMVFANRRRLF